MLMAAPAYPGVSHDGFCLSRQPAAAGVSFLTSVRTLAWMAFPTNRWIQAHDGFMQGKADVAHERDRVDGGSWDFAIPRRQLWVADTGQATSSEAAFNVSARTRTGAAKDEMPDGVTAKFAGQQGGRFERQALGRSIEAARSTGTVAMTRQPLDNRAALDIEATTRAKHSASNGQSSIGRVGAAAHWTGKGYVGGLSVMPLPREDQESVVKA